MIPPCSMTGVALLFVNDYFKKNKKRLFEIKNNLFYFD